MRCTIIGASILLLSSAVHAGTTRVSVSSTAVQGNDASFVSDLSLSGQFVAFMSHATNLVAGDTNGFEDIFVHDRMTGQTTRVSVGPAGQQGNEKSQRPSLSATGRYVVFASFATNLVAGDANGEEDVFIRDRNAGTTALISVATGGQQGNGFSTDAKVSADGRYVVFRSVATNLVAGDTNGASDIFLRDVRNRTTVRVSVANDGAQALDHSLQPWISGDGTRVVFTSDATNLVANDTNGLRDVFVRNLVANTTARVSVSSNGTQADGSSSQAVPNQTGNRIAFMSRATNLDVNDTNGHTDVFVRDVAAGRTTRVNKGPAGVQADSGTVFGVDISNDGRYVSFDSAATNLVAGDTNGHLDIFVYDRQSNTVKRASLASTGAQANAPSPGHSIAGNGSLVSFEGSATNLVPNDTNNESDVFVNENPFTLPLGWEAPWSVAWLPRALGLLPPDPD